MGHMKRNAIGNDVFNALLEQIQNGGYAEGSYLPGERELAETYGVSRPTIRKALLRLRNAGIIYSAPGMGNMVQKKAGSTDLKYVGFFVPDISNPYFSALSKELDAQLSRGGTCLLTINYDGKVENLIDTAGRIAKDILSACAIYLPGGKEKWAGLLSRLERPAMLIHSMRDEADQLPCDQIIIDSYGGAYQIATHLLSTGRRRIAFLSSPDQSSERLRGCRQAIIDAGLDEQHCQVLEARLTGGDGGYEAVERAIATGRSFDALFCMNDHMAAGAVMALKALGRRIPEDVAVAGFDDIPASRMLDPPLTTARQPVERIASLAKEMLASRLAGDTGSPRKILISCDLIVRKSTLSGILGKSHGGKGA